MKQITDIVEKYLQKTRAALMGANEEIISQAEEPFTEVIPTGDLLGCLDAPTVNEINVNGTLIVVGWLGSRNLRIQSLLLSRDNLPEEPITYGLPRPDVAQVFPDLPNAALSGFRWNILVDQIFSGNVTIKIWATLENGERVCCFARRVNVQPSVTTENKPLNTYTFLYGAARKALAALKHKRLPLSPLEWVRKLRIYYRQLQADPTIAIENSSLIHPWQTQDPYQRWCETNRLTPKLLALMESDAQKLKTIGPKISIAVPIYNTPEQFLKEMIQSVTSQIYPHWELCLADDCSDEPHVKDILKEAQELDSRIKVIFRRSNGHIAEATNSALDLATGEYIALLDHDDILPPDALLQVAECISKNPHADWIYTDEDKIDSDGRRYDPQMKGAWSPEMMLTHNYTQHFTVMRRTLVDKAGRMRKGFEGAQDLDLYLRVSENTTPDKILHVPKVCYHWRVHSQSTASHGTQKQYVFDSAYRAIAEAIQRRGLKAKPFLTPIAKKYGLSLHQIKWDDSLLAENPVTIVIPTKDQVELLEKCVASLERTVDKRYVKLIIIDDGSSEPKTHKYLKKLEEDGVLQCRVIPSGRTNGGTFNYARLMNLGAKHVDTPLMLHLNNDVEAIAPGWLEDMVGWMSVEGVAVVGAKLLYPDQTIQHAGVVIGPHDGLADHLFDRLHKDEVGYICLPHSARNVSAVTGACLLTPTTLYRELEGFDEQKFAVQYNDIDYCLKVLQAGKRIVFTPQATLIHRAGSSRGKKYDYTEHTNFLNKYKDFRDPFFNENIALDSMWMAINPHHFCHTDRVDKFKVLFITHNLNLEGAPLMAQNFAKYFVEKGQYEVEVLSTVDGPLRYEYEKLNIPTQIVQSTLPLQEESIDQYQSRLKKIGESNNLSSFDLVVCNTLLGFWGVELARLFNIPSIWHIHESCTIEASLSNFFGGTSKDFMRNLLRSCFVNATRVIFVAEATRQIFQELNVTDNFRTINGAVPIDTIDKFRASHTKSELRAKYGINKDDVVVTVVGTICERKGQHIFVEAIKELEAKTSENKPSLTYVMVGGRVISYLNFVQHLIGKFELEKVYIFDQTKDVYDFFWMSDIFVCSSFEESFPRVLLEAMAFELKIVSTNVFGIPEMICDGHEGYLVEPGNPQALANAIWQCLSDPKEADLLAKNACAKVYRKFNEEAMMYKHLLLTKEAALKQ